MRAAAFRLLALRLSLEQIAHGLLQRFPGDTTMRITHEALCMYTREFERYLRRRHWFRWPRKFRLSSRLVQDLISVDERPAEVADRTVLGHGESDLLVEHANASALGALVERTTRFTLLVPLTAKAATAVRWIFAREVRTLPTQLRRFLTYDQGQEMRKHRLFTKQTKMGVYFPHPQCLWERGTKENINGLLRRFFSAGTQFDRVSGRDTKRVQTMLNDRSRKILNWHSSAHAFHQLCARILNAHPTWWGMLQLAEKWG